MGQAHMVHSLQQWKTARSWKKGSFWWRSMLKLLDSYKCIAQVEEGMGDTILFWSDL
jgi:hypothetical protein